MICIKSFGALDVWKEWHVTIDMMVAIGGRNLVLSSQTKEAGANGYDVSQSSPGKQFTGDPGQTESNDSDQENEKVYFSNGKFVRVKYVCMCCR